MSSLLLLLSLLPLGIVWLSGKLFRAEQTHIVQSGAYPNRTHVLNATHFVEIFVAEPLVEILIHVPSEVSVERVQLINRQFQTVPAIVTRIEPGLLIDLSLPVPSGTNLTVLMQRAKALSRSKQVWHYEIYAKRSNDKSFRQIGTASVFTYSDLSSHQKTSIIYFKSRF